MYRSLLPLVVLMVFAAGCTKSSNNNNTQVTGTYNSMDSALLASANGPQYVDIVVDTSNTFYGASGTRYTFPAGCFVDGSGAVVTGKVTVMVTEYLHKGDMIFSKLLPENDTNLLFTGGEIIVAATHAGGPIYIRPGFYMLASVPQGGTDLGGMNFYTAQTPADSAETNVNWEPAPTSRGNISYVGDSLLIASDSLGLGCAAVLVDSTNLRAFSVTFESGTTFQGSDVQAAYGYVCYDNYKGISALGAASGLTFSASRVPVMPVHIVVCAIIRHQFYGGVLAVTPSAGAHYSVMLTNVTPASFKGQLNVLIK